MKRRSHHFLWIFVLAIALAFTSCVDYVQSITYKNGKYHIYYKITMSKVLSALDDKNFEGPFDSFLEDLLDTIPDNAQINKVESESEDGVEIFIKIAPGTMDETERFFLPTIQGRECYIPFLLGNEQDIDVMDDSFDWSDYYAQEIAEAMMDFAKCRVMVSKKIIPDMKTAYFQGKENRDYVIPFFDYGDAFCLEIPFNILFSSADYYFDEIVIVRK